MELAIIDRGRGPEIAGSRITVYDVLAETEAGASPEQLAQWYQLDIAQIELALRYIDEHRDQVLREYQAIQARHAQGNQPHIQAQVDESHAKYASHWAELKKRAKELEDGHAGPARGH